MNQHIPSRMPLSYLDHFILQKCPIYHTHTYTHTDRERERIDKKKNISKPSMACMHDYQNNHSQGHQQYSFNSSSLQKKSTHHPRVWFNILKRVMNICIRHGSTFKPAIKHLVKGKEGQHGK